MARAAEDALILTVRRRAELRDWREQHHGDGRPVWLASFKKPHPDDMPHEVPVEELLCWGRIESVTRALDADRSMILIAPGDLGLVGDQQGACRTHPRQRRHDPGRRGQDCRCDGKRPVGVSGRGGTAGPASRSCRRTGVWWPGGLGRLSKVGQARMPGLDQDRKDRADRRGAARIAEVARDAASGLRPRLFRR